VRRTTKKGVILSLSKGAGKGHSPPMHYRYACGTILPPGIRQATAPWFEGLTMTAIAQNSQVQHFGSVVSPYHTVQAKEAVKKHQKFFIAVKTTDNILSVTKYCQ